MNIFRLLGDLCHIASKCILIHRIFAMKSGRGLSLKTQAIYIAVFLTRYIDVMTTFVSYYNTFAKLFYIISSIYIVYLVTVQFRPMDDEESTDTFRIELIILPSLILALIFNYSFTFTEIAWAFSIFLEALAILPQLHMLKRTGQAEALTRYYILTLGCYRGLYILNWIYRFFYEGMVDPIAVFGGFVQTALNFYFIYVYIKKYPSMTDIEAPSPSELPPSHGPQVPPKAPGPPQPSSQIDYAPSREASPPTLPSLKTAVGSEIPPKAGDTSSMESVLVDSALPSRVEELSSSGSEDLVADSMAKNST